MKNFLEKLCASRKVPDVDFFLNLRDFPMLRQNRGEAYGALASCVDSGPVTEYEQFAPILSQSPAVGFADIAFITEDDWLRVTSDVFPTKCGEHRLEEEGFTLDWSSKKPTAVFRGSATGQGVTPDTNIRLKAHRMSENQVVPVGKAPLFDVGLIKNNVRGQVRTSARNGQCEMQHETSSLKQFGLTPVKPMSARDQSGFKYILHLAGHVEAYRLSRELASASVVLIPKSDYTLWFMDSLVPMEHYVPIAADISDLAEKVEWCRAHDDECRQIASNARAFYERHLNKEALLDYTLQLLVAIRKNYAPKFSRPDAVER